LVDINPDEEVMSDAVGSKNAVLAFFMCLFSLPILAESIPVVYSYTLQTPEEEPWFLVVNTDGEQPSKMEDASRNRIALPCRANLLEIQGQTMVLGCGDEGVLLLDLADPGNPVPREVRPMGGRVESLRTVGEVVWVEVVSTSTISRAVVPEGRVVPVFERPSSLGTEPRDLPPADSPAPTPSRANEGEKPTPEGVVTERATDHVVIDIGEDDGVKKGVRVMLFTTSQEGLGADAIMKEKIHGVGVVRLVSPSFSKVMLGFNERIPEGALARVTTRRSTVNVNFPPEIRDIWSVAFDVRPFLALGALGGGALLDVHAVRRFVGPVSLALRLTPFGFIATNEDSSVTFASNLLVSYDSRLFESGLGAGVTKVVNTETDFHPTPPTEYAPSIAQYIRLGAIDGIYVGLLTHFVVFEEEFRFGGAQVHAQAPLRMLETPTWVIARGGGGVPGHAFGEVGLRILARGNGGPGSLFLTPTVGGGGIYENLYSNCSDPGAVSTSNASTGYCREEVGSAGPLIGFGMEWRL
jgi:hypothetical protein